MPSSRGLILLTTERGPGYYSRLQEGTFCSRTAPLDAKVVVGDIRDMICSHASILPTVGGFLCSVVVGCSVPTDDGAPGFGTGADPGSGTSGPGSGAPTGGSGTDSDGTTSDGTTSSGGSPTGEPPARFDLGTVPDVPVDLCTSCGRVNYSYIWIANSSAGTVSKINTRTLVEEGRYLTRDDGDGNPSRTSVSIDGRAVAVANRAGGLVKIWAAPENCAGPNTSTGPDDVKPWGTDDCVAWYLGIPDATTERPVAWTSGAWNANTCTWDHQKIWHTSGSGGRAGSSLCEDDKFFVHRINGEIGVVEDTVQVDLACKTFGPYGGAVDSNNDFWITRVFQGGPARAVGVDFTTLAIREVSNFQGYGITVDHEDNVWGGGPRPGKFNPTTSTWTEVDTDQAVLHIENVGTGIAEDQQGRMWVGTEGGLVSVDVITMEIRDKVLFTELTSAPTVWTPKGISVDMDGFIWGVDMGSERAYRVDPVTLEYESVGGLDRPYTYSDMTGGALRSVTCHDPPE